MFGGGRGFQEDVQPNFRMNRAFGGQMGGSSMAGAVWQIPPPTHGMRAGPPDMGAGCSGGRRPVPGDISLLAGWLNGGSRVEDEGIREARGRGHDPRFDDFDDIDGRMSRNARRFGQRPRVTIEEIVHGDPHPGGRMGAHGGGGREPFGARMFGRGGPRRRPRGPPFRYDMDSDLEDDSLSGLDSDSEDDEFCAGPMWRLGPPGRGPPPARPRDPRGRMFGDVHLPRPHEQRRPRPRAMDFDSDCGGPSNSRCGRGGYFDI